MLPSNQNNKYLEVIKQYFKVSHIFLPKYGNIKIGIS